MVKDTLNSHEIARLHLQRVGLNPLDRALCRFIAAGAATLSTLVMPCRAGAPKAPNGDPRRGTHGSEIPSSHPPLPLASLVCTRVQNRFLNYSMTETGKTGRRVTARGKNLGLGLDKVLVHLELNVAHNVDERVNDLGKGRAGSRGRVGVLRRAPKGRKRTRAACTRKGR